MAKRRHRRGLLLKRESLDLSDYLGNQDRAGRSNLGDH